MATRNINLTDALDRFVAEQVESGQFQNASEVVRAGLRALKNEQAAREGKIEALREAIQAGLSSGPGVVVDDIDAYFEKMGQEIEAEFDAQTVTRTPAE
jgi:antitoxin ParD1/3/4